MLGLRRRRLLREEFAVAARRSPITHLAWTHVGPSTLAAFLASNVEFVEALTVILAVGSVRGWRDALLGIAAAFALLALLVGLLGTTLTWVPLPIMQVVIGGLLLLFGLRWLSKAILRAAGVIPLHDEAAAFESQTKAMLHHGPAARWDKIAFGASFQITMLEAAEVVFIVIAIGAGGKGLLLPTSIGALAALALVAVLGVVIHRPLARVPGNALKFVVGILLAAFGTFWFGEGIGAVWPGQDWSILALIAGFLAIAASAVSLCRSKAAAAPRLAS